MTVFIPTQHPLLEGPACPPKTKLVLLSAGGPAHLSLKFGMHSCRQGTKGVGRIHITKLETTTPSSGEVVSKLRHKRVIFAEQNSLYVSPD